MHFTITSSTIRVTAAQAATIGHAICSVYNGQTVNQNWAFTKLWDIAPFSFSGPTDKKAVVFSLIDTAPNEPGALGWHTDEQGRAVGYIPVGTILDNGAGIFDPMNAGFSVASVIAHEVLETAIDRDANGWEMTATQNKFLAREVGDPVQDGLLITGSGGSVVALTNAVLPAYFDPQACKGPYDLMGKLTAPQTATPGGYQIWWDGQNGVTQTFGEKVAPWMREMRKTARRVVMRQDRHDGGRALDSSSP